jgi:hypothetical protein
MVQPIQGRGSDGSGSYTDRYTSIAPSRQFDEAIKSGANGALGGGPVGDFVKNELLGVDDFGNAIKHAKDGNVGGAVKSSLAGVGEIGLTAASIVAGLFSGGTGAAGVQAAKMAAVQGVKQGAKQVAKKAATTGAGKVKMAAAVPPAAKAASAVGKVGKAATVSKVIKRVAKAGGAYLVADALLGGDDKDKKKDPWTPSAIV